MDYSRRDLLTLAGAAGVTGLAAPGRSADGTGGDPPAGQPPRSEPSAYEAYAVHRVPEDYDSIQAAVEAAAPRDLVSVGPGVYRESVSVIDTPRLTVRGRDRNAVVLDGEFDRRNGVTATVDGVVVENLTVRNYAYNGVYWTGVDGYRGSYLTAYNNGEYGVYAFDSVHGRFDHCYASGHPDSGFYVGQCEPCHAVIDDVVAEHNALGYSGTNAGGYLTIRNSVWRENMAGIVPNTLDSEALAPQAGARIEGNDVRANNDEDAPTKAIGYPAFGTGITVAGGTNNEIVDNDVSGHVNFGVLLVPMYDKDLWPPADNEVRGNRVTDSGRADLALGAPTGGGNCFADNEFDSSRPAAVESRHGCAGGLLSVLGTGDPWPTLVLGKNFLQTELGSYPSGDWREGPEPPAMAGMADPDRPPQPPVGPVRGENGSAGDGGSADGTDGGGGGGGG